MKKTSKTTKISGIKIPVVFFGSGPVAAKSLELLAKNFDIEAVITKPKPSHHRGDFPVIEIANKLNLKTFTVSTKAELDKLMMAKPVKSNLGVLIDFGIIVSQSVIDYFPLGIVNSHFSILPEWRGADPITFSILSGQKQTGVSLMLLVEKMDEGPLIGYGEQPLTGKETTPELTDKLIYLSDSLLTHDLPRHFNGETNGATQDITGRSVSYSRKLTKEDGVIDWNKSAEQIEREIRAFAGWPKSRTNLGGKDIVITRAGINDRSGKAGSTTVEGKELVVFCGEKSLSIEELIPAGKNKMSAESFLAGHRDLL